MPSDASKSYGRNVLNFLKLLINKEGKLDINLTDDIINNACVTHGGEIISPIIKKNLIHGNITQLHPEQS